MATLFLADDAELRRFPVALLLLLLTVLLLVVGLLFDGDGILRPEGLFFVLAEVCISKMIFAVLLTDSDSPSYSAAGAVSKSIVYKVSGSGPRGRKLVSYLQDNNIPAAATISDKSFNMHSSIVWQYVSLRRLIWNFEFRAAKSVDIVNS